MLNESLTSIYIIMMFFTSIFISLLWTKWRNEDAKERLKMKYEELVIQELENRASWLVRWSFGLIFGLLTIGSVTYVSLNYIQAIQANSNEIIIDNDGNPVILGKNGKPTDLRVVETLSSSPEVFFFSDFNSGEVTDGGKWTSWDGTPGVVDTTPGCSGFPTGINVLSIDGNDGSQINVGNMYPAPSIGDTIAIRFYICVTDATSADGDSHGIYFSDGSSGWGPTTMGFYLTDGSTYRWMLSSNTNGQGGANDSRYFGPRSGNSMVELSLNTVYRDEAIYVRTNTSTYIMRRRLYNASGTLLYDTFCDGHWANCTTTGITGTPILESATFTASNAGANQMRRIVFGGNVGPTAEMTAIAVCSTWCGPYPIIGVED